MRGSRKRPPPERGLSPAAGWWSSLALSLLLAACGEAPKRPLASADGRPRPAPAAPVPPPGPTEPGFCAALVQVVEAERGGFVAMRAERFGPELWDAAVVPEGLDQCRVEGGWRPAATFVCRAEELWRGPPDLLLPTFERLGAAVDECLARPIWYPRDWQSGRAVALAGGERQRVWRDHAGSPAPSVTLKIEEDFATGSFFVRLAVETRR